MRAVIEELKRKINKNSLIYDEILISEGQLNDIENPEKLYDILNATIEKEGGKKDNIQGEILDFYSIRKNRIRHSLFQIINRISADDLVS